MSFIYHLLTRVITTTDWLQLQTKLDAFKKLVQLAGLGFRRKAKREREVTGLALGFLLSTA